MAKTKISEFSATPANNTDIDSINIAEGCAPSGINDAIRELMAQLKDFQTGAVGDSFNGPVGTSTAAAGAFTTLAASGSVTLSGGTANGVTYLNGSKVLTSGSALTFDGTNFATTGAITSTLATTGAITATGSNNDAISAYIENSNQTGAGAADRRLTLLAAGNTSYFGVSIWQNRAVVEGNSPSGMAIGVNATSAPLVFYAGARTERMRLDSAGNLGLGVTPQTWTNGRAFELTGLNFSTVVVNSASSNAAARNWMMASNWNAFGDLCFVQGSSIGVKPDTIKMQLDPSGNMGLGVTPSAWATFTGLQVGVLGGVNIGGAAGDTFYAMNAYYNAGWKYAATGTTALMYRLHNGEHKWYQAPSGTAGNAITFTQAMTLTSDGNLCVGSTSVTNVSGYKIISLQGSTQGGIFESTTGSYSTKTRMYSTDSGGFVGTTSNHFLGFLTNDTERARITSAGELLVGKTVNTFSTGGIVLNVDGNKYSTFTRNGGGLADFNRTGDDGNLIAFWQDGTQEGNITVTGTTVSYNGGHLSRYAQTITPKDDSIVKGTVLSNLDEMSVYTKDGQPVANEQLNKVKVSDVEGDANVAGVFVSWSHDEQHNVDEINMAMTGDMIIRIAQGVTVVRGDLLMSAGDGTAKPQGDDIVRSKTVAKVTSNHITCTYADGSYCIPCVLMAC